MTIDLTQIEGGEAFELFCEDLLKAMGFEIVQQPTRGTEGGKDLIVSETTRDRMGYAQELKTLVQCKHYAVSDRAVGFGDVNNYRDAMDQYGVQRYLLITSTLPTEDLRTKFEATTQKGRYVALIWSKGDLLRLLDAHPEVRDRYFPPPAPDVSTPAGALAEKVERLLEVRGFACRDRQVGPDRVRLVCSQSGALARPMIIVCKEGAVERCDVEALIAEVDEERRGGGVLVTYSRVSQAARARAAQTGDAVRALTLDAFYRELTDFEPYVQGLVRSYEQSELASYYVDLGCRGSDGSVYKPLDGYVDRWLRDPSRNHMSILGDYGTGKTSFCRQYAAKQGRRWRADPDRERIPILINLREYTKTLDVENLITGALVNQAAIQGASYRAFSRFNADGKLLLLFDGFDEMAQRTGARTARDNFWELAKAVVPGSKVILTCRTPYFRTRRDAEALLEGHATGGEGEGALGGRPGTGADPREGEYIDVRDRPNFEIVELEPFSDDDIQAVLRKRFPAEWEGHWGQIQRVYDLP
ncbi:MAG: restriction endonuclease, partial [Anaerolineae bacterium]|nr:restriction endonuclease [Anaerolineae bacterium]